MNDSDLHILLYCHHTLDCEARSGVQRVVVEAARALSRVARVELVKWDDLDGQLRYLTEAEMDRLFGGIRPSGITANRYCARVNYRFGDTIANLQSTWFLFPEIPYHVEGGNERFARLLSQSKAYGIQTACIFYDLIPVRDPDYGEYKSAHLEYLIEILRCDRIFSISQFSADDLVEFYSSILPSDQCQEAARAIIPVPLGERSGSAGESRSIGSATARKHIVLLGTVEPRKQQTRFLRVFNDQLSVEPGLKDYSIDIFGSLHPASADALHTELKRNPRIAYHRYASDEEIRASLSDAAFSAFISRSEGYGLPIVESLALGVPCLTSEFGAMAEVAKQGGCLTVDSLQDGSIAAGILKLVRDPELLESLREQAVQRRPWTWEDYADDLASRTAAAAEFTAPADLRAVVEQTGNTARQTFTVSDTQWLVARASALPADGRLVRKPGQRIVCLVDWTAERLDAADDRDLEALCDADILVFPDREVMDAFPHRLKERDIERLPSARAGLIDGAGASPSWLGEAIVDLSRHEHRLTDTARKESLLGAAARSLARQLPKPERQLAIVISTYNRAAFCELNVGWLLDVIKKHGSSVQLVVVDNASTDDTVERLAAFQRNRNFTLVVNPSNTGMLGNLHVCSTLQTARHVWFIGDDDYIHRSTVQSVLRLLDANPRIPLISTNFAVYYRKAVVDGDSPARYLREGHNMAPRAPKSGPMEIIRLAEFHDNVFTAIYPLVVRSDLAAACFNYMFDGEPFGDLVESVPTTKFVLEFLARCEGYWLSKPGITGNAHNSWTRFRPRWHSVLVPNFLQLARDSGLSPEVGWRWLNVHGRLLKEALATAEEAGVDVNVTEAEGAMASWLLRDSFPFPIAN